MFSSRFSSRFFTDPMDSFDQWVHMLEEATGQLDEKIKSPLRYHTKKGEEGEEGAILVCQVPGFGAEDLKVSIEKRRLTIEGTLEGEEFTKTFTLNNVDLKKITSTVKNGLLTVTLPSAVPKQKARREIKVREG